MTRKDDITLAKIRAFETKRGSLWFNFERMKSDGVSLPLDYVYRGPGGMFFIAHHNKYHVGFRVHRFYNGGGIFSYKVKCKPVTFTTLREARDTAKRLAKGDF